MQRLCVGCMPLHLFQCDRYVPPAHLQSDLLPCRVLYGSAGVELGAEMATGNVWPDPPQPCGIIAGTQSLSLANPTSWLTSAFRMIPGMPLLTLCSNHSHVQAAGNAVSWSLPCAR